MSLNAAANPNQTLHKEDNTDLEIAESVTKSQDVKASDDSLTPRTQLSEEEKDEAAHKPNDKVMLLHAVTVDSRREAKVLPEVV